MIEKFAILMLIIVGLAVLINSLCSVEYELGLRDGFERGFEEGVRLANQTALEDERRDNEIDKC